MVNRKERSGGLKNLIDEIRDTNDEMRMEGGDLQVKTKPRTRKDGVGFG